MEKEVDIYAKMDAALCGWFEDQESGENSRPASAMIDTAADMTAGQVRWLRGHGVTIPSGSEKSIIHTVHSIEHDQVLCLLKRPFVKHMSLSRQLHFVTHQ